MIPRLDASRDGRVHPRGLWTGAVGLLLFLAVAMLAPWLPVADPSAQDLSQNLQLPSPQHPFGQDKLGRDLLSRVVFGARVSLLVGVVVLSVSVSLGLVLGAWAGFRGGRVDSLVLFLIDTLLAFPGVLLIVGLAAVLGPSLRNTILVLSLTGWTGYARLVRAQVRAARSLEFATAALALGAPPSRVLWQHLLPQALPPLLVQATFGMAGTIVAEASLSFLGLGVQPPTPSWGAMINEGRTFLLVAPHLALAPGVALMVLVLTLNQIGEGLRAALAVHGET